MNGEKERWKKLMNGEEEGWKKLMNRKRGKMEEADEKIKRKDGSS